MCNVHSCASPLVTCTYPKVLPELACRTSSFYFQFASAVALSADMTKETTQLIISNPPYSTTHPQKIPPPLAALSSP